MAEVIDLLDKLEIGVCLRINRVGRRRRVKRLFAVISRLGDGAFWVSMGVSLLMIQGAAGLPAIVQVGLTSVVGTIVYKALKHRLVRERPYIAHQDIACGTPPLDRYSFPSGHTLHAVMFTVMFGYFEPLLLVLVLPFALLVAASRVILGLHYPSDVVVGALIGAALAAASLVVF